MLTSPEGVSPETFKATFDAQDFKRRSVQTYHACDVVMARQLVPLMLRPKWTLAAPIFGWVCFGGLIAQLFSSTGWIYTNAKPHTRRDEGIYRTALDQHGIPACAFIIVHSAHRRAGRIYR